MKTFILVVTLFLSTNGASVQYRIQPADFTKMDDCLKQANDSLAWFKLVLEKAGLKVTSGISNCIIRDLNENHPIPPIH